MQTEKNSAVCRQTLTLTDRKTLSVDRVQFVENFEPSQISISTECGKIVVEGKDLRIEDLSREDGKILICGTVEGIFYAENSPARGAGFFSRFLK